jgi:hypothetical protein
VNWLCWRPVVSTPPLGTWIEVTEQWCLDDLVQAHALLNAFDAAR